MDRRICICNAFWAYNGVKFWVMRQLCRTLLSPRQGTVMASDQCLFGAPHPYVGLS